MIGKGVKEKLRLLPFLVTCHSKKISHLNLNLLFQMHGTNTYNIMQIVDICKLCCATHI